MAVSATVAVASVAVVSAAEDYWGAVTVSEASEAVISESGDFSVAEFVSVIPVAAVEASEAEEVPLTAAAVSPAAAAVAEISMAVVAEHLDAGHRSLAVSVAAVVSGESLGAAVETYGTAASGEALAAP